MKWARPYLIIKTIDTDAGQIFYEKSKEIVAVLIIYHLKWNA